MWTPDRSQIITAGARSAMVAEAAWASLRTERSARLSATDWVVLRNLETNEPVSTEWLEYRQALRDLPQNTPNPNEPQWPEEPT